jgi:glutamate-1-semialdehyde 2,1-aminomutase
MLFDVVFTDQPVRNYRDMFNNDAAKSKIFNESLRASGILKPDSKLYAHLALTEEDLEATDRALEKAANALQQ